MSRAFIKEDAGDDDLPELPVPSGPNYVTPKGLEFLRQKVHGLQKIKEPSKEQRRDLRYWQTRLGSAILVDNSKNPPPDIRFGSTVSAVDSAGKAVMIGIVGQDEADEANGLFSWDSSLGRSLIGRRAGDLVEIAALQGQTPLKITRVSY